jgi:hypothetical protein
MSGFNVNHLDVSPRFAGVLMGLSNAFATIPGFVGPTVAGILAPWSVINVGRGRGGRLNRSAGM